MNERVGRECLVKFSNDAAYVIADSIQSPGGGGGTRGWESTSISGVKGQGEREERAGGDDPKRKGSWGN